MTGAATADDFEAQLEALIADHLTDGCPCRFPRFRATVRRDTSRLAGGSFTTFEQGRLVALYERRVPLVDKHDVDFGWQAKCGKCGSVARQSSNEFAPGGWIDQLVIDKPREVSDVGAPVGPIVYRASAWIAPGPAMQGRAEASRAYPLLPREDWLRWMRERATPATR